ncbi:MAG: starch phosphorylase [Candidatus Omnitrophota bacterium]
MSNTHQTISEDSEYQTFVDSIELFDESYTDSINKEKYFGFPTTSILKTEQRLLYPTASNIAYVSMEYGLAPSIYHSFKSSKPLSEDNKFFTHDVFSNQWITDYLYKIKIDKMLDIPIYSGGLGVLAGDSIKSSADLNFPVVGFGILWNKGYFKQNFWYKHGQVPQQLQWDPHSYPGLIPLKNRITVPTKEGDITLRLWKYYVYSYDKSFVVPLILLDANLEENKPEFRQLTDQLYRSDDVRWKIYQRLILGVGAVRALKSLNYKVEDFHLNEGHAAFAIVEKYLTDFKGRLDDLKERFVYTCHTPVIAGHDRFAAHDLKKYLLDEYVDTAINMGSDPEHHDQVNLTYLSLNSTKRFNAVAQKHGDVMRLQFADFSKRIKAITNGIHLHTWITDHTANCLNTYQKQIGDWRKDPNNLLKVEDLKVNVDFRKDLFDAHQKNKGALVDLLKPWNFSPDVFTICWARRIAGYKRPALLFYDIERIVALAEKFGPIQIVFAGKAHPNDDVGSAHIEDILNQIENLNKNADLVKVLILENYDTYFGKLLTSAVDVWLNNPLPPFEASGTSGMKAIANGVLQLSTLDGWVVEAENDDIGWIFGYEHHGDDVGDESQLRLKEDSDALYDTLQEAVSLYYETNKNGVVNIQSPWIDKMINCIKRTAFFNTQRMMQEYKDVMWSD